MRCSSGSATAGAGAGRRYAPSTFASRSAATSRLTDDCVTSQPSAFRISTSSSCVRTARVLITSMMRRSRFFRSAVIAAPEPVGPAPRARGWRDRTGSAAVVPTAVRP
jgi:hypothetical protein